MAKTITQKHQVTKNMQGTKSRSKPSGNQTLLHPIAPSTESVEIIMCYSALTKHLRKK
ncbi:MAG: hypothetical protein JNK61_06430 [Bacteroidia bacterium]|nr:hypothetical protein [Bacteroidia bacterium]